MQIKLNESPREFAVGINGNIVIKDIGEIDLSDNEMVTFITDIGSRFDFVQKNWGFYATPSINSRLTKEGFKTALVQNKFKQVYVMVVEKKKIEAFQKYCADENQTVLRWLDEDYSFDNSN